jgi:hypothetical protein
LLVFDRGHAEKILHDYARHFNGHRPHHDAGRDEAGDGWSAFDPGCWQG